MEALWESRVGRQLAAVGEWDASAKVHVLVPGGMGDFHWIWCKLGDWVRRRETMGDRVRFWIAGGMRQDGSGCRLRRAAAYARLCGADAVDDPELTTDAVW